MVNNFNLSNNGLEGALYELEVIILIAFFMINE